MTADGENLLRKSEKKYMKREERAAAKRGAHETPFYERL